MSFIRLSSLALSLLPGLATAANLDRELISNAEDILVALRKAKVKVVGVLPFEVKVGARPASLDGSPLSGSMPTRLQNALILRHGGGKAGVVVVRDADRGGLWATRAATFRNLFMVEREPAWGEGKVKADAFLTGTVANTGDGKVTKVVIRLVTPESWKDGKLATEAIHSFDVRTDRSLLRDLGYNYAAITARAIKKDALKDDLDGEALADAKSEEQGKKKAISPGPENVAGLKLEIEYDGKKQEIKAESLDVDGARQVRYTLNPAKPGQSVMMYLTRVSRGDELLGAVLKLNGRSTFMEETDDPLACRKWVYEKAAVGERDRIKGFYWPHPKGEKDAKGNIKLVAYSIKVLTGKEAEEKESELGTRGGWIDLDVFTTREKDDPADDELTISSRSIARGRHAKLEDLVAELAKLNRVEMMKFKVKNVEGVMVRDVTPAPAGTARQVKLPNPVRLGGISIRYAELEKTKVID